MNLLFTGVGGQGTILTTKLLSSALAESGYDVKMSEIHGMSQRGGTVLTQLKYGDKVYAPNITEGEADYIIAFEKSEAIRAIPWLKPGGTVVYDEREILPMPVLLGKAEYPHDFPQSVKSILIPAYKLAAELGSARDQNIVMLGAIAKLLGIEAAIPSKFNAAAYKAGGTYIETNS
ncbi:MAG: indolepyruvate oxidoreductase subunit beta [Oscillospiraceae bacterium]|jgi:indolepyruvate ferredoxin oxidoreductase beta subunit|nr:indolepyruvate oxidoreductase subunit beta [Oscillospiraceae bacterium]